MRFVRSLDPGYPHVWDSWKVGSVEWVVQDLPESDYEEAIKVLVNHLCTDEVLCLLTKMTEDQESVDSMKELWRVCFKQRMCLGCYELKGGVRTLAALNVCVILSEGEEVDVEIKGTAWRNVYGALAYADHAAEPHKFLDVELLLSGLGLVVRREYRGHKLGAKLLAAREPLALSQGIYGTATVFTGIASQKVAASCGFQTILEVPIAGLSDQGLDYPKTETRSLKVMAKKFKNA